MPIANVIDKRKRPYCSCPIHAVIEPSCADNDQPSADQYDPDDPNITTNYEEMPDTSVYLAINWANRFKFPVTLYLYDGGRDGEQEADMERAVRDLREAVSQQMSGKMDQSD